MEQRFCYGCMRPKQQSPVCEHCGHDERQPNMKHQLPVGTVLNNQYILGKVLGQGGFGITYIGWDTVLAIPIAIYMTKKVNRAEAEKLPDKKQEKR